MATRFNEVIEKLKSSQSTISNALNEKLGNKVGGGLTYKFSEMADKIREIEVGGGNGTEYTLQVEFETEAGDIGVEIYIGSSDGESDILKATLDNYKTHEGSIYTWKFNTNLNDVYVSGECWSDTSGGPSKHVGDSVLVKNINGHKGIKYYVQVNKEQVASQYRFIDSGCTVTLYLVSLSWYTGGLDCTINGERRKIYDDSSKTWNDVPLNTKTIKVKNASGNQASNPIHRATGKHTKEEINSGSVQGTELTIPEYDGIEDQIELNPGLNEFTYYGYFMPGAETEI